MGPLIVVNQRTSHLHEILPRSFPLDLDNCWVSKTM